MWHWWLENKDSGKGRSFVGTIQQALRLAQAQCKDRNGRWCVWEYLPGNRKIAEVSWTGPNWVSTDYRGQLWK